jgi:anti-sigma factor RsiW
LFDRDGDVPFVLRTPKNGVVAGGLEEAGFKMMDYEAQLKLQSYLDGELPEAEAREVANLLARDKDAAALFAELRNTRQVMKGFEAGVQLPESREFFWSKIERQIRAAEAPAPALDEIPLLARLRRLLLPLSSVGAVAAVVALLLFRPSSAEGTMFGEMELASKDMGALTYRSQSEGITMVWFYNRSDPQFTAESSSGKVTPE